MASPGNIGKDKWIRCNCCRTRRRTLALLTAHYKAQPECRPCNCGGYHFSHTPGSPYCYQNPKASLRHALRRCETEEEEMDVWLAHTLQPGQATSEESCPF